MTNKEYSNNLPEANNKGGSPRGGLIPVSDIVYSCIKFQQFELAAGIRKLQKDGKLGRMTPLYSVSSLFARCQTSL